jgi:hypothetical protein
LYLHHPIMSVPYNDSSTTMGIMIMAVEYCAVLGIPLQ